ncbi:MAG: hypothetical protein IRZ14_18440 [Chloroflexi bacterium]|nr:hypothetical protein [Chloroflexota bacterium]
MRDSSATAVVAVRARLAGTRAALAELEQALRETSGDADVGVALEAAVAARLGLSRVEAWLAGPGASAEQSPLAATTGGSATRPRDASASIARLVALLAASSETLSAEGERLEDADPIAHFDAVQGVGLAVAVLEASFQRLLRAGLASPRPMRWADC